MEAGKPAEAEAALGKALEMQPDVGASSGTTSGVVRTRRGNFTGAVEALPKAIGLDASFEAAKANLARAEQLAAIERAAS